MKKILPLFVLHMVIAGLSMYAQSPELLKDIRLNITGSATNYLTVAGNLAFFSANDGINGATLWKTDGTPEGTVMVVPPGMGIMPISPRNFLAVGNLLYFNGSTAAAGQELWKSDGTAAGTFMIKDVNPGPSGTCDDLCEVNGIVYYRGTSTNTGLELFKSDGTPDGTGLVKDINPGPGASQPQFFVNLDGTLIFNAAGTATNFELWKSDGTDNGTVLVKEILTGTTGSGPMNLTVFNGQVYFSATNGASGRELWKSDGTELGTVMVKNINPNAGNSAPQNMHVHNGVLYFGANDGTNGLEPWRSDGTEGGTTILRNIYSGSTGSNPRDFSSLGDTLVFIASTSAAGAELWKSNGTSAGTVILKDINPGSSSSTGSTPYFAPYGNKIYFAASGGAAINTELYQSDGTGDGTTLVADIVPGAAGSYPEQLIVLGDKLLFFATTADYGKEIWKLNLSSSPALLNWTGNVSTAWEDANNWEPVAVPGSNTEVIIPSGRPRYPVINANTSIKKISCATGASVQIASGILFNVLQ